MRLALRAWPCYNLALRARPWLGDPVRSFALAQPLHNPTVPFKGAPSRRFYLKNRSQSWIAGSNTTTALFQFHFFFIHRMKKRNSGFEFKVKTAHLIYQIDNLKALLTILYLHLFDDRGLSVEVSLRLKNKNLTKRLHGIGFCDRLISFRCLYIPTVCTGLCTKVPCVDSCCGSVGYAVLHFGGLSC